MMTEHETILLRQLTEAGDAEAFSEITRRYAGLVYGACLRVTGDAECARDATQDTFFQLLKHAGRVTGSLGGWLHQVATRRAVDLVRRDKTRRERERAFAAASAQESDSWAEVSPLVDEAMNEIEPGQRDLLLRHFLQGESTVQLAAAEGVSQPTMSRRVEAALEQLRERLRKKGVVVAAAVLGTLLAGYAQAAPAAVLAELGKISLATSGSAAASAAATTVLNLNVKLAIAAAIAIAGVSAYVGYKATHPAESTPFTLAVAKHATTPVAQPQAFGGRQTKGGAAPAGVTVVVVDSKEPTRSGGVAPEDVSPAPTPATPEGVIILFVDALMRDDPARIADCFAGTTESEAFRRLWKNPADDAERKFQQALKSSGLPIEVTQTTAVDDGIKVRWKAAVLQPFAWVENGIPRSLQKGDRFELELRLKQMGGEWKIVGF